MAVRIEAGDPEPLVDQPVGFRVVGLAPSRPVEVRVSWTTAGVALRAQGAYVADQRGVVDPGRQPSLAGTYSGCDGFGLWWSARPAAGELPRPSSLEAVTTMIEARAGGEELAATRLRRRWVGAGVTTVPVREDGLVGLFCAPSGAGPFPAVLVVGGSMGGLAGADTRAALLASRGFAALALAYFGIGGRPPALSGIPLEDLRCGLTWLLARPAVGGPRAGVLGSSRGAELALLLGATFPEVGCVVAGAPSGVVWSGLGPGPPTAAWTWDGRPVTFMKPWRRELLDEVYAQDPVRLEPLFGEVLGDEKAVRAAEIPVERSTGPVLLVSGEDDALWPSARMGSLVERRAEIHGMGRQVTHLRYPDAGHLCLGPPGLPQPATFTILGRRHLMGGTPAGNSAAAADSWDRTLLFLRSCLSAPAAEPSLAGSAPPRPQSTP